MRLYQVGMPHALHAGTMAQMAVGEHRVQLLRCVRAEEAITPMYGYRMIKVGAALGRQKGIAFAYLIKMCALGALGIGGVARGQVVAVTRQQPFFQVNLLNPDDALPFVALVLQSPMIG